MQRHQRSLGGWSFIMKQYYDKNITRCVGNLRLEKAMELVNPYSKIMVICDKPNINAE